MKRLRGRKALVTGAASGIGRALARALAREGVDLFLVDVDTERLLATTDEMRSLGVEAIEHACDLGSAASIAGCVETLQAGWSQLHLLVNNAGILYYDSIEHMSAADWDRLLDVNLRAPVQLTHALLPLLRAQDEAHILNVSSLAGLVPRRRMAAYATSKHGLVGFSLSLRAEIGPAIGVSVVCPGLVDTQLVPSARERGHLRKMSDPPRSLSASPERVAKRALEAIRKDRALVTVTGHARALWLLQRLSPRILDLHQRWNNRRRERRKGTTR